MREIHNAKLTYNDLKPSNIMLQSMQNGKVSVSLIDYGYAKKYKRGNEHIDHKVLLKSFQGNIQFSSKN